MNNKINNNVTRGLYIPNIEATWIYKKNMETGDYKVKRVANPDSLVYLS